MNARVNFFRVDRFCRFCEDAEDELLDHQRPKVKELRKVDRNN